MGKIVEILQSLPDFYAGNPASAQDIAIAEEQLGVAFSEEYREYVKAFGDASANGHELTGISSSERIDVVSVTQAERVRNSEFPAGHYVVERTGVDRVVVCQDAAGIVYQSAPGRSPERIFDSLSDYVAS